MKTLLLALVLAASVAAGATPVTGTLAIAGLNKFNSTAITFDNPAAVLQASDSLGSMFTVFPQVTLENFNFASAPGTMLFDWNHGGIDINMVITTFVVETNSAHFLNVSGTALFNETGDTPTLYDFTLASTHPDGMTSFTMDIVAVPEPMSLVLMGIGLTSLAGLLMLQKRWKSADRALSV